MFEKSNFCPPHTSLGDHGAAAIIMLIAAATIVSAVRMARSLGRTPEQDPFARVSVLVRVAALLLAFTAGPFALWVSWFFLRNC